MSAPAMRMSRNLQVWTSRSAEAALASRSVYVGVQVFPRGSAAGSAVWAPGEGSQGYLKDRQPF